MDLSNLLTLDCTRCAVQGTSKKRVLEVISDLAAKQTTDLTCGKILTSLTNREKMGSTGVGNGIAIPHGRLPEITQPIAVLVTCETPVDFDAIDGKPVDILFALLVPEEEAQTHLSTLAAVAEKLSDKDKLKAMRDASTNEQLLQVLM